MPLKQFQFTAPHTKAEYNTNNAWGFGGGRGVEYTFSPELTAKIGLAGTRHMGEFPYITVTHKGRRIIDQAPSAKSKAKADEFITHILAGSINIIESKDGLSHTYQIP